MLMRSIYGETPEGAVPVEDRGPNKEKCEKHFAKQSKLGWGPQQIGFRKESHRTKLVGVAETAP
ncbi:hypothetical protein HMPREF2585_03395 [Staphylococcus sp. HMSC062D12]|nr:hypothetical protein HMPREF2585_03395 [Staphylococcus sp. HMSC062D12]